MLERFFGKQGLGNNKMFVHCHKGIPMFMTESMDGISPEFQSIGVPDYLNIDRLHEYRLKNGKLVIPSELPTSEMVVVMVTNWGQNCGISTYSQMMHNEMASMVKEVHVVSEKKHEDDEASSDGNIHYCWHRNQNYLSMVETIDRINPDLIIVQHEFGIFKKCDQYCALMSSLSKYRVITVLHTVLEHRGLLSKDAEMDYESRFVFESSCQEVMVHQPLARDVLRDRGYCGTIHVIPHGCPEPSSEARLPIGKYGMFSDKTIFQYGFGGRHKGWEFSIEVLKILKDEFPDVFYFGVMNIPSGRDSSVRIYHHELLEGARSLGLSSNYSLLCGYQSEKAIRNFMRSFRVVMYPYQKPHSDWASWGASGAIQLALSYARPIVITSYPSFMEFSDSIGFCDTPQSAADKITKIFSDESYEIEQQNISRNLSQLRNWKFICSLILSSKKDQDTEWPLCQKA